MSATREDALPVVQGRRLPFDEPLPAGPDPTSDIADEVTSELGGTAAARAPLPLGAIGRPAAADNVLRERYVLETRLGAGGTAVVHRAVDLRRDANAVDGRRVAIKLLRPELRDRPHAVARLQREFRQSLAAAHAGVVRVFDLDCDRGAWFIVMELLSGEPLGTLLRRPPQPGLPAAEALRIAVLAGDALAHAHAVGVVHGDVKPDNLFLTGAGELRILDFGSAPEPGVAEGEATPDAATRAYASPERLGGAGAAPADDVFSLACVTYEMLAGEHPFGRERADRAAVAGVRPRRIGSLDAGRWAALEHALSYARTARPSMAEFVRGLRREGRGEGVPAAGAAAPPAAVVPQRLPAAAPAAAAPATALASVLRGMSLGRRPWPAALAAAAALVLVLVAGILIGRRHEPRDMLQPPAIRAAVSEQPAAAPAAVPAAATVEPRPGPAPPEALPPSPVPLAGPPGLVFFDSPRMTVSHDAVVAAIPMRNLSKVRRAATVNWRIVGETAVADRDFAGPLAGRETFIEGNSFRILYVPILQPAGARRERRFVVEMTDASAGTELGPTPRVEVTILGGA